ncbi:DUF459 domain-containing protein, partial [Frankia sp. AiPs1]|nr:DUF459 domain-containing protein [Frankia sp. AiPs1]
MTERDDTVVTRTPTSAPTTAPPPAAAPHPPAGREVPVRSQPRHRTRPPRVGADAVPARRALLLVVAVLGLLAALRAPAMVHTGEGMRPGLTRTLVLSAARPIERATHTVRLDAPDRWLTRAFGHGTGPRGGDSELA